MCACDESFNECAYHRAEREWIEAEELREGDESEWNYDATLPGPRPQAQGEVRTPLKGAARGASD